MMGVGTEKSLFYEPPQKTFVVKLTQVEENHLTCPLCPLLSSPDERMTADGTHR